jgi:hypothetical protein
MRTMLLVCTLGLLAGCFHPMEEGPPGDGGVDAGHLPDAGTLDAGPGPDGGVVLYGAVKPDCAPNDGPAFRFLLSDVPVDCAALDSTSEGFYVWLWASALEPRAYPIGLGFSLEGQACLCGVVGDNATSGTVTLDVVTDAGVTGHIDATFQSGTERHDAFHVLVCPGLRQCG